MISRKDPLKDKHYLGSIDSITKKCFKILLSEKPQGFERGLWRIDKAANKGNKIFFYFIYFFFILFLNYFLVTFDRMQKAIDGFTECNMSHEMKKLVICYGDYLKLANEEVKFNKEFLNPSFNLQNELKKLNLNESQTSAIQTIFNKRLSIVQGFFILFYFLLILFYFLFIFYLFYFILFSIFLIFNIFLGPPGTGISKKNLFFILFYYNFILIRKNLHCSKIGFFVNQMLQRVYNSCYLSIKHSSG